VIFVGVLVVAIAVIVGLASVVARRGSGDGGALPPEAIPDAHQNRADIVQKIADSSTIRPPRQPGGGTGPGG
jgi:hypothetical protein